MMTFQEFMMMSCFYVNCQKKIRFTFDDGSQIHKAVIIIKDFYATGLVVFIIYKILRCFVTNPCPTRSLRF